MSEVTALRYAMEETDGGETMVELDALIAVEVSDTEVERGIDLHLSPRTEDVVTASLSAQEAWALARELGRAATNLEQERLGI